ncbi:SIR2 family NAD-dependent protein deacylase [Symbioplanes lichenis]|uniref:SIR2 family NAD-dependent protein deacylase n=1 Tax=Symbioplanes lichenis TaxID=1629072 RepID=UPI00273832B6|nr:SIR2 family protein [Actinoplanes lichenis]
MDTIDSFGFEQVARWLADGQVIPFLGAGASRVGVDSDPLPDGHGLASELRERMAPYPGDKADDLAKVAQYYEEWAWDRPALYEFLHERFHKGQVNAAPARVARMLASIPAVTTPRFIVTTNYDNHVEDAFALARRPLCVVIQNMRDPEHGPARLKLVYPDGTKGFAQAKTFRLQHPKLPAGTTFLFKMHGSAHQAPGSDRDDVIITENDYVDFLINTGGPVSPLFPPAAFLARFRSSRFLFLGYSLADWNFRAFLRLLVLQNAISRTDQLRHLSIQLRPDALEAKLWQKRNVKVYDGDLVSFCDRLAKAWAPEETS